MELIREEYGKSESVEHQVIFRWICRMELPKEKNEICQWNRQLAKNLMKASQYYAERSKEAFLSLKDRREKAKYRVNKIEYCVKAELWGENNIKMICRLTPFGNLDLLPPPADYIQVWNWAEETLLCKKEISKLKKCKQNSKD